MIMPGSTLSRQPWRPSDPQKDHDHCEFCRAKFALYPGCLREGFSTPDRTRRICSECCEEHRDAYQWNIDDRI